MIQFSARDLHFSLSLIAHLLPITEFYRNRLRLNEAARVR